MPRMAILRTVALIGGLILAIHAPVSAQVYRPPGPPPDQSALVSWVISLGLFLLIVTASLKSSKRSHQD